MKNLIYLVSLIALTAISCGVASTLPTAAPRPLIDMEALYPAAPTMPQTATESPSTVRTMLVCNSGGLNVRTGAGTQYAVIDTIADGRQVTVIGVPTVAEDLGLWQQIDIGYVNAMYLCEVVK